MNNTSLTTTNWDTSGTTITGSSFRWTPDYSTIWGYHSCHCKQLHEQSIKSLMQALIDKLKDEADQKDLSKELKDLLERTE